MTPERSYAVALADAAMDAGRPTETRRELGDFLALLAESADLRNFLASPAVGTSTKHAVIAKLVERLGASETIRNFLFLIVDHRRVWQLDGIAQAFGQELNARLGILEAEIRAARELDDQERQSLVAALERRTGKRIEPAFRLDPGLLGGVVVRIGSTIYDGSVRAGLERLHARMAAV
jgi:F-type H+-transporting ATPase subunit delta